MILFILSIIILLILVASFFIKNNKKILIMSVCVIALLVCNFINEIQASFQQDYHRQASLPNSERQNINILPPLQFNTLDNQTFDHLVSQLLQEERSIMNYLYKKWENNENLLVTFDNLHKNRLKMVLQGLSYQVNLTNKILETYFFDYKTQYCSIDCLYKIFQQNGQTPYYIFVIENIDKSRDLNNLQEIYFKKNISIIFQSIPKIFAYNSISRLTERYAFSNNYLPKILEHHPSKIIQHCSLYHTFDYNFYQASQTVPLAQLCSRPLPINPASKCVRKYINQQKARIPEGWARDCLKLGSDEGIIYENGWIGLKKQHYWSGRVNKTTDANKTQL